MRNIIHILLLATVIAAPAFLQAQKCDSVGRKKVAVVLSGGGAKGVAHIGALRVIEEAGIPIDMIVGVSMGSIIGGLYSIGYTPDQLDSMVMKQNWELLLSDRAERRYQPFFQKEANAKYMLSLPFDKKIEGFGGLIKGSNLEMLFNDLMVGYHDTVNFRNFRIPFTCVASNIVDGREVVFQDGILPVAMRASMAIPGVFTPVYLDGKVLVDGGVLNNFPTNIAMEMGADVIIGVDVQSTLRSQEELVGAGAVLAQIAELVMQQRIYRRNVGLTNIHIKVDVDGFSAASFNQPALDSLIRRGYEAAVSRWDELADLKRKIGVDESFRRECHEPYLPLSERGNFHVYNISFDRLQPKQEKWVMRKSRIKQNSDMSIAAIKRSMLILNATSSYSNIYYSLKDTLDGYNLRFHMNETKDNSINLGMNFESEEIASVLLNGTFRLGRKLPMETSITGRFGRRIMAHAEYSFFPTPLNSLSLGYTFNHNDININRNGRRYFNTTYNHHLAKLSFNDMNFLRQNLRFSFGMKYEHFIFRNVLRNFNHDGEPLELEDGGFISYFGRFDFENLDHHPYFALKGTVFSASYELYSDNFFQYKGHAPFSALSFSWMTAIPLSKRFSLIPGIYGRVMSGEDIPFQYLNMIGGKHFGRYFPQQMPFDGIGYMEAAPHIFMAAKLQARQRIAKRHFVSASLNYGLTNNGFSTLLSQGDHYFGASIDYGLNIRILPITASLSWSNVTNSPVFYIQAGYMF